MGLCVLYYVEYSLYNVKKVGFFYLGWNYTLKTMTQQPFKILGKGVNQHFLTMFPTLPYTNFNLRAMIISCLQMLSRWTKSKV